MFLMLNDRRKHNLSMLLQNEEKPNTKSAIKMCIENKKARRDTKLALKIHLEKKQAKKVDNDGTLSLIEEQAAKNDETVEAENYRGLIEKNERERAQSSDQSQAASSKSES